MRSKDGLLDVGRHLSVLSAVVVNRPNPLPELHLGQDIVYRSLAAEVTGEHSLIGLLPKSRRIDVTTDSEAVLLVLLASIHNSEILDSIAVLQLPILHREDQSGISVAKSSKLFDCLLEKLIVFYLCEFDSIVAEGVVGDRAGEIVEVAWLGSGQVLGSPEAVVGGVGRAEVETNVFIVKTSLTFTAYLEVALLIGIGSIYKTEIVFDFVEVVVAQPLQHFFGVVGPVERPEEVELHSGPSDPALELREGLVKVLVAEDGLRRTTRLAGGDVVAEGGDGQQSEQAQLKDCLLHLSIDCTCKRSIWIYALFSGKQIVC